jgi:hypothetical protein
MDITITKVITWEDVPAGLADAIILLGCRGALVASWNDNNEYEIDFRVVLPEDSEQSARAAEEIEEFAPFLQSHIGYAPDSDAVSDIAPEYARAHILAHPGLAIDWGYKSSFGDANFF